MRATKATAAMRSTLVVRMVVALVVGGVGLPLLAVLVVRRDTAARLGAAFAVWALVSAAAAGTALAWSGEYWSGTGAVFVVVLAAAWAAGRALPADVLPWLRGGLVAGAVANALVAVAQGPFDLDRFSLSLFDERSTGFLGNPVFLGAVCAAALPLARPLVDRTALGGGVVVALLAAAVQMSGTRVALALLVAGALMTLLRVSRRAAAAVAVAVVLGVWAGGALQADEGTAAARRLGQPAGGLGQRGENWRTALDAVVDRPLVGYGPGRYVEGTSPRRTLELARHGSDRLYFDGHNLVIEYAVTTGVVGVLLLCGWLAAMALSLRRSPQLDLVWAAAVLLAFHLLEPQHVVTTPLMFLLAGAAAPRVALPTGRLVRTGQLVLVAAALVAGGRVLVGDLLLYQANLDFREEPAEQSAGLLRPWVEPLIVESRVHVLRGQEREDPSELVEAERLARLAADRNPADPLRAMELAGILVRQQRHRAAADAYRRALAINPWSKLALTGRAEQLEATGDQAPARACRELLAVLAGTRNGSGAGRSRFECLGA